MIDVKRGLCHKKNNGQTGITWIKSKVKIRLWNKVLYPYFLIFSGSLGRIVTFIMFLIFLFLYTSYAANIVALLQSSSNQIRTLSDLLSSKLELGVEDQPYTRYYFTVSLLKCF